LRIILLTRDKKALIKKINSKKSNYDFRKSMYILSPKRVQNFSDEKGTIKGTELIFFENNPNPITHEEKPEDLSKTYLDDVIVINFIQQTTDTFGKWDIPSFGFFNWFIEKPARLPIVFMVLSVLFILARNYLEGLTVV
jgi:hypothetical protein